MKKKLCLILLLLGFIGIWYAPVYAATTPPNTDVADKFLPKDSPITITDPNQALYNKYPITRYYLDAHYSTWAIAANVQNSIQNAFFQLMAVAVKVSIYVLQYAYTLDIVKELSDIIDSTITAMRTAVWDPFLPSAITLLGLWGIYRGFVKREITSAAGDLLKHFFILVAAIYMFTNTSVHLGAVNNGSQEISADLLAAAAQVDPYLADKTSNGALIQAGNSIWKNFVYDPWELMMFGKLNSGYADQFLSKAPLSDERQNLYDDANPDFDMMEEAGLPQRYLAIFLISITGLFYLIFMLILSGAVILSQIVAVFIAVIGPIVFIMSLWPGWGTVLVQRWFRRLFGALFVKVGLSVVLSVMLILSSVLHQKFSGYGIVIISLMQLLLVIGIILERKRLTSLVNDTITKGSQATGHLIEQGSDRFRDVGQRVRQVATQGVGLAAAAYTGNPSLLAAGTKGAVLGAMQHRREQNQNSQLEPVARASLENQYAIELAAAQDTGEFSPLVKRTNDRLSQGLPMFTNKDIAVESERLKDIQASGGDVRKVLLNPNLARESGQGYLSNQERFRTEMEQIRTKLNVKQSEMSGLATETVNSPVKVDRQAGPEIVIQRPSNLNDEVIYQSGPPPPPLITGTVSKARDLKVEGPPVTPREAPKAKKITVKDPPQVRMEGNRPETSNRPVQSTPEPPKERGPKK